MRKSEPSAASTPDGFIIEKLGRHSRGGLFSVSRTEPVNEREREMGLTSLRGLLSHVECERTDRDR